MNRSGGYILHLDATHEGDAPVLMTGMDGLKQIVLGNVKIPSKHADHIVPFLEQLQKNYGTPIACVHDMGTGLCKAVYLRIENHALDAGPLAAAITKGHALENMNAVIIEGKPVTT